MFNSNSYFFLDLDLFDNDSADNYVTQHVPDTSKAGSVSSMNSQGNKDDRKAELERRREERRQVTVYF